MVVHNVVNECCLHIRKAAELICINCSQRQRLLLPSFTSPAILVELCKGDSTWLGYLSRLFQLCTEILPSGWQNQKTLDIQWLSNHYQVSILTHFTALFVAGFGSLHASVKKSNHHIFSNCTCYFSQSRIALKMADIVQNVCLDTFSVIITDLIIWLVSKRAFLWIKKAYKYFCKESKKLYHKSSFDEALDDDDVRSAEGWPLLLLSPWKLTSSHFSICVWISTEK